MNKMEITTRYNNFNQSAISFGREIRKKFISEGKRIKKINYYHNKYGNWVSADIYYEKKV